MSQRALRVTASLLRFQRDLCLLDTFPQLLIVPDRGVLAEVERDVRDVWTLLKACVL